MSLHNKNVRTLSQFVIIVSILWTAVLAISLTWSIKDDQAQITRLAEKEARAYFDKDQAFRSWAVSHGGVYVPVDDQTPPNPYMDHVRERDVVTRSGRLLTLMSPASMLRQMMTQNSKLYGIKGKVTGLKAIIPENRPDKWERQALLAFEKGTPEIIEIAEINGSQHLRLIKPMITQKKCLNCHAYQGYRVGDILGATEVAVPMAPFWKSFANHRKHAIFFHVLIWGLGLMVLFFLGNRGKQVLMERDDLDEERLKNNELMESILESLEEGVVGLDKNGKIILTNPATEKLSGYSKAELLNESLHEKLHHSKADGTAYYPDESLLQQTLTAKNAHKSTGEVFWHKNGTSFPVKYTSTPLGSTMACQGGVVTFRDVTKEFEEQKTKQQMYQMQKMEAIGALAGGIAHDFNNILTIIIGFSEIAKESIPPGNPAEEDIEKIIQAGYRAKDLTKQILTFSRRSEQKLQPILVQFVADEALKLLRASIPSTIEFRQKIDTACNAVLADPTQIQQVIMNLCTNSFYAMNNGGIINIEISQIELSLALNENNILLQPGSYVRLVISDTGHGIDHEVLKKIFDPYFSTKPKDEGTGLGLAISRGIVKSYGGEISVTSAIGKGTTFKVYLPTVREIAATLSETAPKTKIIGGNEKILIVDDEESISEMQQQLLSGLGYAVTARTNSLAALDTFKKQPGAFDLIITDMTMPDMTGLELAREITNIRPEMPIILCTGFGSELVREDRMISAGIRKLIQKPLVLTEFAQGIREALTENTPERESTIHTTPMS